MNKYLIISFLIGLIFILGIIYFIFNFLSLPEIYNNSENPGDGLIVSNVSIDSVDVLNSPVQPGLYFIVIKGMLPDSCSQVEDATTSIKPNQIDIVLQAKKPSDAVCEPKEKEFEINKEIDFSNLPSGEYLIKVAEFNITINYTKPSFDN